MSNTQIRMVGHGVDLTINAGMFSGLPTYVTAPRAVREVIETAYRNAVNRTDGGMSWRWNKSRCVEIEANVFERRLPIELALYERGEDGISRMNKATRRVFRFYVRTDYR